jgi:paraquat-inducible protein A
LARIAAATSASTSRALVERHAHSTARRSDAALACASAALVLLVAANLQVFLTTAVYGVSRQSQVVSSAIAMVQSGYPELGIAIGLFIGVFPVLRTGLLTVVLATIRLGRRPACLGPAFRLANALQVWAMPEVFALAAVVAWARLGVELSVVVGDGALCFATAAALMLLTRAALDKRAVWEAIGDAGFAPGPPSAPAVAPFDAAHTPWPIACLSCGRCAPASDAGMTCPRCHATLHARKPQAVARTTALLVAAALLYIPANLYPMATLPIGLTPTRYTVLQGVIDLADAKLVGLALLVLVASFVIPLAKLAGLVWCIASVVRRSSRHLVAKTRTFAVIEEIGRWSMIDPFVIACFVPVTQYNALISGRAEAAAPAFAAVVILTTLAAHCFDPRLMWDAARPRSPR